MRFFGDLRLQQHGAMPFNLTPLLLLLQQQLVDLSVALSQQPKLYGYFGYGSNTVPSTMFSLRGLTPINATAAILPNYELIFAGASLPGIEGSAAFVRPCHGACVHGVLYTLTADDFATVGNTEGVPFFYRWQSCNVHPYTGDAESAGKQSISSASPLPAFVLKAGGNMRSSPPSASYLGLLQEGSKRWKFDSDYQSVLRAQPTAKGLIPPQGTSGLLLKSAEFRQGEDREYYWKLVL